MDVARAREKDLPGSIRCGRHKHLTDCNFSVLEKFPRAREEAFLRALFAMSYDNPAHREMMDLEGLKKWLPGRTSGYDALARAVAR